MRMKGGGNPEKALLDLKAKLETEPGNSSATNESGGLGQYFSGEVNAPKVEKESIEVSKKNEFYSKDRLDQLSNETQLKDKTAKAILWALEEGEYLKSPEATEIHRKISYESFFDATKLLNSISGAKTLLQNSGEVPDYQSDSISTRNDKLTETYARVVALADSYNLDIEQAVVAYENMKQAESNDNKLTIDSKSESTDDTQSLLKNVVSTPKYTVDKKEDLKDDLRDTYAMSLENNTGAVKVSGKEAPQNNKRLEAMEDGQFESVEIPDVSQNEYLPKVNVNLDINDDLLLAHMKAVASKESEKFSETSQEKIPHKVTTALEISEDLLDAHKKALANSDESTANDASVEKKSLELNDQAKPEDLDKVFEKELKGYERRSEQLRIQFTQFIKELPEDKRKLVAYNLLGQDGGSIQSSLDEYRQFLEDGSLGEIVFESQFGKVTNQDLLNDELDNLFKSARVHYQEYADTFGIPIHPDDRIETSDSVVDVGDGNESEVETVGVHEEESEDQSTPVGDGYDILRGRLDVNVDGEPVGPDITTKKTEDEKVWQGSVEDFEKSQNNAEGSESFRQIRERWKAARDNSEEIENKFNTEYADYLKGLEEQKVWTLGGFKQKVGRWFGAHPELTPDLEKLKSDSIQARKEYQQSASALWESDAKQNGSKLVYRPETDSYESISKSRDERLKNRYQRLLAHKLTVGVERKRLELQKAAAGDIWARSSEKKVKDGISILQKMQLAGAILIPATLGALTGGVTGVIAGGSMALKPILIAMGLGTITKFGVSKGGEALFTAGKRRASEKANEGVKGNLFAINFEEAEKAVSELMKAVDTSERRVETTSKIASAATALGYAHAATSGGESVSPGSSDPTLPEEGPIPTPRPEVASGYSELPEVGPVPEMAPVPDIDIETYTVKQGDTFWDWNEGQHGMSQPPAYEDVPPENLQAAIKSVETFVDTNPALKEALGFVRSGNEGFQINPGDQLNSTLMNSVADFVLRQEGYVDSTPAELDGFGRRWQEVMLSSTG